MCTKQFYVYCIQCRYPSDAIVFFDRLTLLYKTVFATITLYHKGIRISTSEQNICVFIFAQSYLLCFGSKYAIIIKTFWKGEGYVTDFYDYRECRRTASC